MSMLDTTNNRDIVVELTESKFFTRWPCHVCQGYTEKVNALAEVPSGPYQGLRVCETCLEVDDIDTCLARSADEAEEWENERVKALQALIGRLQVPSFAEWQAYNKRLDIATFAAHMMRGTFHEIDAESDRIMHDDETYQAWQQRAEEYFEQSERKSRAAADARRQAGLNDDFPF